MSVFEVDYWIDVLHRDGLTLDEQSRCALMDLFCLTEKMASVGRDNRREFWITAKRGTPEEYRPYYEFNGHHPWEILPSYSTEDSGHLYVGRASDGYYFSLSGSSKTRSREIIRCFLTLRAAGLPVRLHEGNKMRARLEETDMIGIVPEDRTTQYVYSIMEYNFLDAVHLYDGDKAEQVAEKTTWKPEIECKLL